MKFYGLPVWAVLGGAAAAIAVVLSLYTVRWRLPQRIVGTTALWHRVTSSRRGAGRLGAFEHLLSMLLQLAIALALVIAVGQPRLGCQAEGGRQVVLVLDRSASMGTQERVETRLETARRRAISRLESAAATDELSLVLAGGEPEVAIPLGRDPVGLRLAITRAQLRAGPGRLAEAVERACGLVAGGGQSRLVVITDGAEPLGDCPSSTIEPILIGGPRPNVGVTAFGTGISPHDPLHASAFVQVMNSWRSDVQAELRVDLDGKLMQVAPLTLKAGETVQRTFNGIPLSGAGQLEARLSKIVFTDKGEDALHEDDRAFTVIARRAVIPIDLIGTSEPLRLVLAANPRYLVTARPSLEGAQGAVQVVAGPVGPLAGSGRYLLVDPSGKSLPFQIGDVVTDPQITAMNQDHPILRRVVFSDVSIEEARRVKLPASATAVVEAPMATPLVFAEVNGTQRIAGLTFDLTRSNLPLRVGFPVLIYNMIDWLLQTATAADEDVTRIRSSATLQVSRPSGKPQRIEPQDGVVEVDPYEAGFYSFASLDGKVLRTFGISVASPQETQIQPRTQPTSIGRPTGTLRDREISTWMWLAALALLLLEWLSYHRRVTV